MEEEGDECLRHSLLGSYLLRRVTILLLSTLLASILVFGILRILPGDVATVILSGKGEVAVNPEVREALREELGLNDPLHVQYWRWLLSMITGEFGGRSLVQRYPIGMLVARQLPVTLLLTGYTVVLTIIISVPLGVLAAMRWNRWQDYLVRLMTIPGQALPNFWVALIMLLGLALIFRWSPPIVYTHPWEDPWNHLQLVLLPVLLLAWEYSSHIVRVTRSSVLQVLHEDFVTLARAKGLPDHRIMFRHALRSALAPTITILGLQLGTLLGGTLIVESIFGLPGLGRELVTAALTRDYPVVQSIATLLVLATLSLNLVIDLIYRAVDPRISFSAQSAPSQP
ncbi:MAG: ABC transporter permease [Thaumarchaeota archaeon]|nr:ABC transporter permease [Nitrososphaerota archaeon]